PLYFAIATYGFNSHRCFSYPNRTDYILSVFSNFSVRYRFNTRKSRYDCGIIFWICIWSGWCGLGHLGQYRGQNEYTAYCRVICVRAIDRNYVYVSAQDKNDKWKRINIYFVIWMGHWQAHLKISRNVSLM